MPRPKRKSRGYTLELQAGEIVPRGRSIVLTADSAIDPEAWRGVAVAGHRVAARASKSGRRAVIDTSNLPVGAHTLHVSELWSQRSRARLPGLVMPFILVDSRAPLRTELAVQHAVRLRFGALDVTRKPMVGACEAGWIDVFKAEHRRSGKPVELAFDARGRPFDVEAARAALARRRRKTYGKLHPTLHAHLQRVGHGTRGVDVAVWMAMPDAPLPVKPEKGPRTRQPAEARRQRRQWGEAATRLAEEATRLGATVQRLDAAAPVVFARVPTRVIPALARLQHVGAIFLHRRGGIDDLGTSIAIANSDDAHALGFDGSGVDVAVYERGPDDTTNLDIDDRFDSSPSTSQHSRHTHGIIKNVEANRPHGHAPDCNLYSANSYDLDALRWAVEDIGCTVISQSFHRDDEQTDADLSFDDVYKDHLALHWPYPTICEAAGNGAATEYVNHKGFNRLTVGNHNDSAGAMASDSVFRNPASTHGDRELPEISANGTGVTAVGLTLGGTSMAAPAVAGAVACIQEANSTLRAWPEGCRAIMLASAWRNPAGSTWRADLVAGVDGTDGAGALDTRAALDIARARKGRNNAAAARGFDVGTIRSADVGAGDFMTYVYRIAVPRLLRSPRVKVALAWDSKITMFNLLGFSLPIASTLTVDLDLHIRDASGATVATSTSWDNSYEIAEFDARPGATYEIRIRRWSGTDDVWYGVAWQVRGISFLVDLAQVVGSVRFGTR